MKKKSANAFRAVITGATSMIGVACIKACIANGCEVLAIVREGTRRLDRLPKSDLITLAYADLDTLLSVEGDGQSYDVFYHFAWGHTSKEERDNPLLQQNNIRTTLHAVELAKRLGCKKFIGAGSQAEYGPKEEDISADTRPEPIMAYGMAKLSANLLSRRLCEQYGIAHIWGRIFSVYGCHDNEGTMLNYAIDKFINGETALFSAATQMWNYLYEDDAGEMFYRLGQEQVDSGIYCIANPESYRLREYIDTICSIFGESAICEFAAVEPCGKVVSLKVDMTKTVESIAYKPVTSFQEGIEKIIQFRKKMFLGDKT